MDAKKLKIVVYPDRALRTKAQSVKLVTEEVRAVAARMIELMHEAPGIGLAATQVGVLWRMFVAIGPGDDRQVQVFINPVLSNPSKEMADHEEGCLSLPEINGVIRRPKEITVTATDLQGNAVQITSDQIQARIWQHETDHLDGILIIDRMAPMDKMANQRAIRELEQTKK